MNTIKSLCVASLLISGVASAATPCDGFELKLQNNLNDDLVMTTAKLRGAEITPNGFSNLKGKTSQFFVVNSSNANTPMAGEFIMHTISLPSKNVVIKYELTNYGLVCLYTETPTESDFSVSKMRLPSSVYFTIDNK